MRQNTGSKVAAETRAVKWRCVERLCGNCVEDGAQAHFLRSAGIQGGIVFQLPYWVMEAGEGKSRHILTYRCKIEGE